MKSFVFVFLFLPQVLFAALFCEGVKIDTQALLKIPHDVDLASLIDDNRGDLFKLGYKGVLCGHQQLGKEGQLCFTEHDKDAAYEVFDYFRALYRKSKDVHLQFVQYANDNYNSVDLFFFIKEKRQRLVLKRCLPGRR